MERHGSKILAAYTAMYLYLSGVLFVTLMPILASLPFCFNHPYIPMHMAPFEAALLGRGDFIRQIVLNVIMTIPFGFLFPLCRCLSAKRCGLLRCLLMTVALTLSIELLQPLLNAARSSDITDVITNTTGGLIGYAIYAVIHSRVRNVHTGT